MGAHDPDGMHIRNTLRNMQFRHRALQTQEAAGALSSTILVKLIGLGWKVEVAQGLEVTLVRDGVRLDFTLRVQRPSSVRASTTLEHPYSAYSSEPWEIYGDNPYSWEDAVAEAVRQVTDAVQAQRTRLDLVLAKLRGLPDVQTPHEG